MKLNLLRGKPLPPASLQFEIGRLRALWSALRSWLAWLNGDTAYLAYLAHQRNHHPDLPVPCRAEFYRLEVARRWNSIRRCC